MGVYDTVILPCPQCHADYHAQSKGADMPMMKTYRIYEAPVDVMSDVNRHAPYTCERCGTQFEVIFKVEVVRATIPVPEGDEDEH